MNHRDVRLLPRPCRGDFDVDIQAYTGTLHREFNFLVDLVCAG